MHTRLIGGVPVGAIGLGAMPMSTEDRPPRDQAVRTVHAALDAGVTLIDTADAYCSSAADVGHNERLVGEAVAAYAGDRDAVLVATKGGHTRLGDGSWGLDGRPEHLRRACEASLSALGVEAIGLYQLHRPDPAVPVPESVGALADLQREGKVRLVGVSNLNEEQIHQALEVADIVSVQNEFSPRFRSSAGEIDCCAELGLAFLAWSPLGGMAAAGDLQDRHPAFAEVAAEHGVSAQQVALAWELDRSPCVIPIPGASRPATILDSAAAASLVLTGEQRRRLDSL
jgi:aryl-alcohol dehydrogenase-like predicted oxidoreductase